MSDMEMGNRKRYKHRTALDDCEIAGDQFAEWIKGMTAEKYAKCVSDYCKGMKNCEQCTFYNGVCRLNRFPWDWDFKE